MINLLRDVPFNRLSFKTNSFKRFKLEIDSGIVPLNQLYDKSNISNFCKFPLSEGICCFN
jgi:hypothetical protein